MGYERVRSNRDSYHITTSMHARQDHLLADSQMNCFGRGISCRPRFATNARTQNEQPFRRAERVFFRGTRAFCLSDPTGDMLNTHSAAAASAYAAMHGRLPPRLFSLSFSDGRILFYVFKRANGKCTLASPTAQKKRKRGSWFSSVRAGL